MRAVGWGETVGLSRQARWGNNRCCWRPGPSPDRPGGSRVRPRRQAKAMRAKGAVLPLSLPKLSQAIFQALPGRRHFFFGCALHIRFWAVFALVTSESPGNGLQALGDTSIYAVGSHNRILAPLGTERGRGRGARPSLFPV